MIIDRLDLDENAFRAATGWEIKPEGACKGDVCVPLPDGYELRSTAERLGMALIGDRNHDVWALGPASLDGRALTTAELPELILEDLDGEDFDLASLRGQKVVLVAWAPY
jgi:hypothetical protein